MEPEIDSLTIGLAVLLVLLFLLLLGCTLWIRISRFCEALRYVNMELQRCPSGDRKKWRRRRRRLWLRLFWLCR